MTPLQSQRQTPKMGSGHPLVGAVIVAAITRAASDVVRRAVPADFRQPLPLRSGPAKAPITPSRALLARAALAGAMFPIVLGLVVLGAIHVHRSEPTPQVIAPERVVVAPPVPSAPPAPTAQASAVPSAALPPVTKPARPKAPPKRPSRPASPVETSR